MKTSMNFQCLICWLYFFIFGLQSNAQQPEWNKKSADQWFKKREWLGGTKGITPLGSIDRIEFAKQYHAAKKWWDEAFVYLSNTNLAELKPGKYSIDGDDVYATVYEGPTKNIDTTKWESHRKFEDIHFVFRGKEQIGITSVSSAKPITGYNDQRDLTLYTATGKYYPIAPGHFMIAFTHQAHRPALHVDGYDSVKHVVVKVRKAQ